MEVGIRGWLSLTHAVHHPPPARFLRADSMSNPLAGNMHNVTRRVLASNNTIGPVPNQSVLLRADRLAHKTKLCLHEYISVMNIMTGSILLLAQLQELAGRSKSKQTPKTSEAKEREKTKQKQTRFEPCTLNPFSASPPSSFSSSFFSSSFSFSSFSSAVLIL